MTSREQDIVVNIAQGVHGRVATNLARIAGQFDVRLSILCEGVELDCSSVLDVLSMGFVSGTRVRFRAQGKGADQALTAVERLLSERGEP